MSTSSRPVEWDLGTEILPQRLEIWAEKRRPTIFYYGKKTKP